MRRLPDERRADVLLARRELTATAVDAVASRLARFHAEADAGPAIAPFGRVEVISRNVEENFAQTREVIEAYLPPDQAQEIARWQKGFLRDHAALFDERIATGRVRDGHGDLRLEHVYFDRRDSLAPTIIDCIEFNDRFRFADVCADVAFLSMDLEAHGRVDLAERFLAAYAREASDYDLFALVDFYESYRAFVRAKVAMILAADPEVDARVREKAVVEARRHLLLALAEDRRSLLLPAVVAVGGVIASGKSTVSEAVGAELSAPVVDADRTRKAMLGVAPEVPVHEAAWSGAYDPRFTERVYDEVFRRADVVLASGRPVVIDASFRSPAMRESARRLAASRGASFLLVECRADPEVCRRRLAERERQGGVSDGRLAIFDAFRARFEPVTELSPVEHLVVDTTGPLEDAMSVLRERLATWPPGLVT
jgi:predicted kinase